DCFDAYEVLFTLQSYAVSNRILYKETILQSAVTADGGCTYGDGLHAVNIYALKAGFAFV
ncbi:MAG TPA: hypothetical protein DIV41_01265, partial [Ruminococcaceae bacterium]|nr:hypothetical protein [Oscillospiraceae bacterium]